jgi:hypothetical protein
MISLHVWDPLAPACSPTAVATFCSRLSQIAVALGPTAYLWNAADGSIEELCSLPNEGDYITSVQWAADSTHLAIGTSSARVQVGPPSTRVAAKHNRDPR